MEKKRKRVVRANCSPFSVYLSLLSLTDSLPFWPTTSTVYRRLLTPKLQSFYLTSRCVLGKVDAVAAAATPQLYSQMIIAGGCD